MCSGKVSVQVLSAFMLGALGLWLISARQPAQGQEGKSVPASVAVVDNDKVEQEYTLFQAEKDRLEKIAEERRRELDARLFLDEDEWKQIDTLLAKPNPSEADKKEIEKLIKSGEAKRQEWQDLIGQVKPDEKQMERRRELERIQKLNRSKHEAKYEEYAREIDEMQRKVLDELFNKVKDGIGHVARQRGYSVVVLKQSVIWSADTVDITDDVLKQLNSASSDKNKK